MKSHKVENYINTHRQAALIVLAVLLVTGASGFFMGMRQTRNFSDKNRDLRHQQSESDSSTVNRDSTIPIAASYSELADAGMQPNAGWKNILTNLPMVTETRTPVPPLSAKDRKKALATRESRRAYDGAPPIVPHPITQRSAGACMTCHGDTGEQPVIAGKIPPRMSHAYHASCTQCHVSSQGNDIAQEGFGMRVKNTFIGRESSGLGSRAYPKAPPTIPHHTLMRENCASCHGVGRANAITTSHPDRQSCTQCHAPSAEKDQRLLNILDIRKPVKFPVDLNPAPEPTPEPEPEPAPELALPPETPATEP